MTATGDGDKPSSAVEEAKAAGKVTARGGTNPLAIKVTQLPAAEVVDEEAPMAGSGGAVSFPLPSTKAIELHRSLGEAIKVCTPSCP